MKPALADFTTTAIGKANHPFVTAGCQHLQMRKAPRGLSIDACPECGRLAFGKQGRWEWSAGFVTVPFTDLELMNAAMACAFKPARKS